MSTSADLRLACHPDFHGAAPHVDPRSAACYAVAVNLSRIGAYASATSRLTHRMGTPPPLASAPQQITSETLDGPDAPALPRFSELGLSETMLAALESVAYEMPTPVQAGIIPRALAGIDVLGQARTGTGKTAAFAIPILEKLDEPARSHPPRALILVPTRELAVQVRDEIERLSHGRRA